MEDAAGSSVLKENGDNEDSGITMVDVLEEEQELEDDANAVLGGSDDQNCTYIQGYVKRQALYACVTCLKPDMDPAGICLACSYACHEGHDLYELYTKRNFRCDCGNSKFPNNPCRLWKTKQKLNLQNAYNPNFQGKYCTCARPYPDPEDDTQDEMIQCSICEDWYHGRHLGGVLPDEHNYSEMICNTCMEKNTFLWRYQPLVKETVLIAKNETDKSITLEESLPVHDENKSTEPKTQIEPSNERSIAKKEEPLENFSQNDMKKKSSDVSSKATEECQLSLLPAVFERTGPSFWPEGWRKKLCKCKVCMENYESSKCLFLLEEDDTVHAYEEEGKVRTNGQSQYDKGMSALNSLGRVQQVEAIHEYNNMKEQLKEYLKKFAESKKVVREEDIHEFFNEMQAKKRQRVDNFQIPHFCR